MNDGEHPGLYLHVPFCRSKCGYCDFYSVASAAAIPTWLEAIAGEMLLYRGRFPAFDSLYLGGGTPTILGARQLAALMAQLRRHFTFAHDAEITIEANPDDIAPDKLKVLRDLGINRLSLGIQSVDDRDLAYLGRSHRAGQALKALDEIRASGFPGVGVDLIYGLEGQSLPSWQRTLEQVLVFRPEHLSCYQLTFAKSTPLGKQQAAGRVHPISEQWQRAFFLFTSRYLRKHGYHHYEVSNFAQSRETRCRHNLKYWNHVPTLGLGPSAHSFQAGSRWWNVRSIKRYCGLLESGQAPVEASETLSADQLALEALALGLRTSDGAALHAVGDDLQGRKVLEALQRARLVTVANGRIQPTRRGFLVADSLPLMFCSGGAG